jgi:nitroreductase
MAYIRKLEVNQPCKGKIMISSNLKKKTLSLLLFFCSFILSVCAVENVDQFIKSSNDTISKILSERYSGYTFDNTKIVSFDDIRQIAEAGKLTPSSSNNQPWVFIICDRTTNPKAYAKALGTLVEQNREWAKNAPVLIIAISSTNSANNGTVNRWAQYDTGAATFSMMLQATSLGLMAHQMGGFDENKLRQEFSIPNQFVPMSVMAIGYGNPNESKPKKRKPLNENFYLGTWGQGMN